MAIAPNSIEIINADLVLATLTDNVPFEMEMLVEVGRGSDEAVEGRRVGRRAVGVERLHEAVLVSVRKPRLLHVDQGAVEEDERRSGCVDGRPENLAVEGRVISDGVVLDQLAFEPGSRPGDQRGADQLGRDPGGALEVHDGDSGFVHVASGGRGRTTRLGPFGADRRPRRHRDGRGSPRRSPPGAPGPFRL